MNYIKVAVLALTLAACGVGNRTPETFRRIDAMCDSDPAEAIRMLDSIEYGSLSENDRHRYDLLSIKARDKAYETHTSDSLVLDVIRWYSSHCEDAAYPEALYYGGRVYSDLGDYPVALDYFHKALSSLPDTEKNLNLRANILSQTGLLLDRLRMYSKAVPYVEESIELSRKLGDRRGLAHDCMRLAGIYIDLSEFDKASECLDEAERHFAVLPESERADIRSWRAALLYYMGMTDSALNVVRGLPELVDSAYDGYTLSFAAKIYLAAGKADSAYVYAGRLLKESDPSYRGVAFSLLFDERIKRFVPADSVESFSLQYAGFVENQLNVHDSQEAVVSESRYNYERHKERAARAEKSENVYLYILCGACVAFAALFIYMARSLFKRKRLRLALRASDLRMEEMEREHGREMELMRESHDSLEERLNSEKEKNDSYAAAIGMAETERNRLREEVENLQNSLVDRRLETVYSNTTESGLKEKLLQRFMEEGQHKKDFIVSDSMAQSAPYRQLLDCIKNNKLITDVNIWTALGSEIEKASPDFRSRLQALAGHHMTDTDYQIAILIRCRVSTGDSAKLLGIMKNSVSSRKASLAAKIFGNKNASKYLDALICTL